MNNEKRLREVIRKMIEEETEVQLIYGQPDSVVIYSTDQSEDPMGLVPLQSSKPKNHLRVQTYADTFLEMAEDGGSVNPNRHLFEAKRNERRISLRRSGL